MSIRRKIFLAFLSLIALSVVALVNLIFSDLKPRYRETVEEPLVDFSTLVASILEVNAEKGGDSPLLLSEAYERLRSKQIAAQIYAFTKSSVDLRAYLTDSKGRLLYDSELRGGKGADYSIWRDVRLTLAGEYGARTSRDLPDNSDSSVMYVAAPIKHGADISGVLTLGKPTKTLQGFIERSKVRLIVSALIIGLVAVGIAILLAAILTRPIEKLTEYARSIASGQRPPLPEVGGGELRRLAEAFETMRESLEGKKYVEQYVETLTHEIKSPLSAIRGAAELLGEPMPQDDHARFVGNIKSESIRLQQLVDKLLLLSSLEARKGLKELTSVDCVSMAKGIVESLAAKLKARSVEVEFSGEAPPINGEPFLIERAIRNIIENAIDFSPNNGKISVSFSSGAGVISITVSDRGPGVPEYALSRVFERFYSLARPGSDRKSTGLGLSLVKEVAELHGGSATLTNGKDGGAIATLLFSKSL